MTGRELARILRWIERRRGLDVDRRDLIGRRDARRDRRANAQTVREEEADAEAEQETAEAEEKISGRHFAGG
jgi:hypothetical protein